MLQPPNLWSNVLNAHQYICTQAYMIQVQKYKHTYTYVGAERSKLEEKTRIKRE